MQRYQNNIQDQFGSAISGVTVTVRRVSDGGLASLFSDNGVTGKSNPFTNDADGEFFFYAADDRYDIFLTGSITDQKDDVLLQDMMSGNTRANTDIVTATPPTTEAVTGRFSIWDADNTDVLAELGYSAGNNLRLINRMHGGQVVLAGENASGTFRTLFSADPDGLVSLHDPVGNVIRMDMHSTGRVRVYSDDSVDASQRTINFCHADETVRAQVGMIGSVETRLRSLVHGAAVVLDGEDTGGTLKTIFSGDPDGGANMYHGGLLAVGTGSSGSHGIFSVGNTDTESRLIGFHHQNLTRRGVVGFITSDALRLRNEIHSGHVILEGEDAAGSLRQFLVGDPDARTDITGDTDVRIYATAGADLSINCVANGGVELYYNNQINLRTVNETTADVHMGAEVRHYDDTFHPVGMNDVPEVSAIDSGNETLHRDNAGKMIHYNSATARSLLMNNDGTLKAGTMWSLLVGPSAGTLTGDGGTGVQIRWWNGTGWTTTAAAGNITIGVGQYTIWKETDTLYHISGPTLS